MVDRSNRREVRNPILALPATRGLLALPPQSRRAIEALLADLVADARRRAEQSWRKNKGPMAAYWKATGAYAEHLRRILKRSLVETAPAPPPAANLDDVEIPSFLRRMAEIDR